MLKWTKKSDQTTYFYTFAYDNITHNIKKVFKNPSTCWWMDQKKWSTDTVKHSSALKRNAIVIHGNIQMTLDETEISEIS